MTEQSVEGSEMSGQAPYRVAAIDGPSASGKSTVARRVAQRLGWLYVDSGALYRAVTWMALRQGVDTQCAERVAELAERLDAVFYVEQGAVRFRIDGQEPRAELRGDDVTHHVSPVSAVPRVRRRVVGWLRGMRSLGDLVMEGRDIGTAVFPDADFKFYLDASPEERARRRHRETAGRVSEEGVRRTAEALRRRDRIDSGRAADPLRVAGDADVIDSTGMAVDEVVELVLLRVGGSRGKRAGAEARTARGAGGEDE